MEVIFIVILLPLLSIVVASYAARNGRRRIVWFLLSLLISPLVTCIILFLLGPNEEGVEALALSRGMKKCPQCAELVKREASMCRYCHSDLSVSDDAEDPLRWREKRFLP